MGIELLNKLWLIDENVFEMAIEQADIVPLFNPEVRSATRPTEIYGPNGREWVTSNKYATSPFKPELLLKEQKETLEAQRSQRLEKTWTVRNRDGIAILPVSGVISRYDNWRVWYSGGTSIEDLATDFHEAENNDKIKAILLDMDTPGGEATGVNEFSEMVKKSKKPVYAYVGGQAASGGYWIASATKKIYADPTAEFGSIGVVFGFRKQSDKIVKIISTLSPKKQLDPASSKGQAEIQARADALADIFIGQVAKYRNVSSDTVINDFGQGGMFIAQKAIDVGMADKIGSLEGTVKILQEKYKTQTSFGGYMGMITDLRALVAGKDDKDIEVAFASLGYAPKVLNSDNEIDTEKIKADAKEEGFKSGKEAGKAEALESGEKEMKANFNTVLDQCELAEVSSPKFIKELLDLTPDKVGDRIQDAKASETESKTVFSTVNPLNNGGPNPMVAEAKKRAGITQEK